MFNMVQRWTEGSYWHGKIHFAGCIRGPQGQSIVEYVWLTWDCNCDVMRKLPCYFSRPSAETYALYWKTIILLVHWAGKKLMNFSSIIKYFVMIYYCVTWQKITPSGHKPFSQWSNSLKHKRDALQPFIKCAPHKRSQWLFTHVNLSKTCHFKSLIWPCKAINVKAMTARECDGVKVVVVGKIIRCLLHLMTLDKHRGSHFFKVLI